MKKILNNIILLSAIVIVADIVPESFKLIIGFWGGWVYCKLQQKGYVW